MKLQRETTPRLIRAIRCTRLGLHFLCAAGIVAGLYPFASERRRIVLLQRWSRQLLDILAIRLDASLTGAMPGSLIVANHISWLDIYALNALRPTTFVAKAEVRDWPLVGWLAAKSDTIFLRRGSHGHARVVNTQIGGLLSAGRDVAIFPEGTTTDGTQVLNFHGALLQAAVDTGRPVQPVAISYHDANGQRSLAPAYAGATTMRECFAAILACRSLTVRLCPTALLDPLTQQRRELAQGARDAIAGSLGLPCPPGTPAQMHRQMLAGVTRQTGFSTTRTFSQTENLTRRIA